MRTTRSGTARTGLLAVSGPTRRFHGQRLTMAATVPIRGAAELAQRPYVERTIDRTTAWRWDGGRRVFELVAPGGRTYVMQSHSVHAQPPPPTLLFGTGA